MKEWFRDERFVVYCAQDGRGEQAVRTFLDALKTESERVKKSAARVEATIRRFAKRGKIRNNQQFKALGDKVVEFKHHQIRIFGVMTGREGRLGRLILTHGIKKKRSGSVGNVIKTTWSKLESDPDWGDKEDT